MRNFSYKNKRFNQTLNVENIDEGVILPLRDGKGGVVDSKKKFVSLSYHDGEWFKLGGKYDDEPTEALDETVVYLGVFIHQWGHFILDSLSRAWIILHLNNLDKYKFAFISENGKEIDGNYLEALELLGLKASQIIVLNKAVKCKKIIVPQMSTFADHGFNKEYPKIFKQMIKNANVQNKTVPNKIYLTRTNLKEAQKKEFGEKIIEDNFRLNGYTIVAPEKLNVREQIALFQNAKEIVCLNGSIPFDVVFSSSNLKLVVINKTSLMHVNLLELSEVAGIHPIYINGYYEPFKNFPKTLGEGPFILLFGKDLELYFKKNNLKYNIPSSYPTKIVMIKYTFNCLKILGKNSIKRLIGKK